MERWTEEKAWRWYNDRPWIRGCNYIPSDCANKVDQWQEYGFEKKLATVKRELELAASIGFNSIRVVLSFDVWHKEHDVFLKHFDQFLGIADSFGITVMPVLGNDCTVPKSLYKPPVLGPQTVDFGYHGGITVSPHDTRSEPGWSVLDEPEGAKAYYQMVRELVSVYAHDERIIIWDLFNEPGCSKRKSLSLPHMVRFFEIAREIDPIQPLTAPVWTLGKSKNMSEIEQKAVELSDIISYHLYGNYDISVQVIDFLIQLGRPLINTEWLHRIYNNNVNTLFPLFYLEKIGAYNWGLVAGKNQTYEPWESIWKEIGEGKSKDYDITKWQHDLFRPGLRPYDPAEIEIIKRYCAYAEEKYKREAEKVK